MVNYSPEIPDFPTVNQFLPCYGKFDLTTYIQGASDYEIMANLVQLYNTMAKGYNDIQKLSTDTTTAYNQLQNFVNDFFYKNSSVIETNTIYISKITSANNDDDALDIAIAMSLALVKRPTIIIDKTITITRAHYIVFKDPKGLTITGDREYCATYATNAAKDPTFNNVILKLSDFAFNLRYNANGAVDDSVYGTLTLRNLYFVNPGRNTDGVNIYLPNIVKCYRNSVRMENITAIGCNKFYQAPITNNYSDGNTFINVNIAYPSDTSFECSSNDFGMFNHVEISKPDYSVKTFPNFICRNERGTIYQNIIGNGSSTITTPENDYIGEPFFRMTSCCSNIVSFTVESIDNKYLFETNACNLNIESGSFRLHCLSLLNATQSSSVSVDGVNTSALDDKKQPLVQISSNSIVNFGNITSSIPLTIGYQNGLASYPVIVGKFDISASGRFRILGKAQSYYFEKTADISENKQTVTVDLKVKPISVIVNDTDWKVDSLTDSGFKLINSKPAFPINGSIIINFILK